MDPSDQDQNDLSNGAPGGDGRTHVSGLPGEDDRWLRSAPENSSEIVKIVDSDGTLRYASPSFGSILGYDPQETIGTMNVFDHVHADDLPRVLGEIAKALSGDGGVAVEYRFRRKDGLWRWLQGRGTHLPDGPHVGGVVVSVQDVTERREIGKALMEGEQRFASVVRNAHAYAYRRLNQPGWPNEYASDYALELTGYPPEDLLVGGKVRLGDLIVEEDRERVWDEVQAALAERRGFELRYSLRRKDGEVRHAHEYGQGVFDEDGSVVAIEGLLYDVTEREEAEAALRETEERYRTLVERIPAIVYVQELDEPSRTTYVSPQNEAILGYAPEECVSDPHHWIGILHPDDRERVLAEDKRTGETGEPFLMEYRQFAKDGRVVWIRDEAALVRDEAGEPSYWLGVQTDVTGRREAEEALRRSEASLIKAQRIARLGTWDWDPVTGQVWWSEETYRIHGFDPGTEMPLREKVEEAFFPEDLPLYKRKIAEALSGASGRYDFEHRLRRPDGEVRWVHGQAEVVRDDEGRPLRVVGTVRDMTERRLTEAKLRETEARYRSLVERVPVAIYRQEIEHKGAVSYISPQIETLTGYAPGEYADPTFWVRTMHPDDRKRVLAEDERTDRTGEPFKVEFRKITRDGRLIWLRDEAVLVRDAAGEPLYWQGVVSDITERKNLEERLEHQAFHDPLTDLPNRRLFVDRLGQALGRTRRRKGRRVAVLFMDLDGFKGVNDSLGHEAGDLLLVVVAERLKRSLRPEDTLARFGGDEFVVLLEEVEGPEGAVGVAERIIEGFGRPFLLEGRELYARASIGIGIGDAWTKTPEDLLRDADTAMYRAKEKGSGYSVFDPTMHKRALGRLELENDLRRAVEQGEFVVHYQPIVDLNILRVWGVEALVRWDHPERGLLSPSEFVPLAEETGLIVPIGRWVLEEACHRTKGWQVSHPGSAPLAVIVNFSAAQLRDSGCAEDIEQVLQRSGLWPGALGLDVTESAFIDTLEGNAGALSLIKSMGVRISIDDFGTGYSSLSYLRRLPADAIKIDKSFVSGLGEHPDDTAIVRMTVELAHTLGMEVIAEGVETRAQAEILRGMGCDLAQGFLFSEPLPLGKISALLPSDTLD